MTKAQLLAVPLTEGLCNKFTGDEMNTQHTPGPWLQDFECCIPSGTHPKASEAYEGFEVKDEDGWPIAFIPVRFPVHPTERWPAKNELDWDEAVANLRIISAAPELLEACRALIDWCDQNPPAGDALFFVKKAREAVAKAFGA
jgi:hypothetical protein